MLMNLKIYSNLSKEAVERLRSLKGVEIQTDIQETNIT